jgi:hypothetical protein
MLRSIRYSAGLAPACQKTSNRASVLLLTLMLKKPIFSKIPFGAASRREIITLAKNRVKLRKPGRTERFLDLSLRRLTT